MLFNFNWRSKSLFKFLFKHCIQDENLHINISIKDISTNHRDKGSIFIAKILWLLYGDQFKDCYGDRHLGNNINSCNIQKEKSKFVQYTENLNKKMSEAEILIDCPQECKNFFEYIGADFKIIESLKKTCRCLNHILQVQKLIKPLSANDMFDVIVHIQRKINEKILTHAMMKKDKSKFHDLISNFRNKKDEIGDEATAQSSIPGKIKLRREIFEECLKESGLDLGIKHKKLSKKQKEDAYWASNGLDPVTGEILFEPQVNHGNATCLRSDPGKVDVINAETNRLISNLTPEQSGQISKFHNNL
jgi:hypothetical protein